MIDGKPTLTDTSSRRSRRGAIRCDVFLRGPVLKTRNYRPYDFFLALDCGILTWESKMLRRLRRLYQKATPETLRETWRLRPWYGHIQGLQSFFRAHGKIWTSEYSLRLRDHFFVGFVNFEFSLDEAIRGHGSWVSSISRVSVQLRVNEDPGFGERLVILTHLQHYGCSGCCGGVVVYTLL